MDCIVRKNQEKKETTKKSKDTKYIYPSNVEKVMINSCLRNQKHLYSIVRPGAKYFGALEHPEEFCSLWVIGCYKKASMYIYISTLIQGVTRKIPVHLPTGCFKIILTLCRHVTL